jgi:hypothetical protein
MNIRKRALKRMARVYKDLLFAPPYPYVREIIKQSKIFSRNTWSFKGNVQLGCQFCGGSGEYNYGDSGDEDYDECMCARTGKGTGFTNKRYKIKRALIRRHYFKQLSDLPFDNVLVNFFGAERYKLENLAIGIEGTNSYVHYQVDTRRFRKSVLVQI